MTVIVAYKDYKTYHMASDSHGYANGISENFGNKLQIYDNYILGFSRSYRIPELIQEEELIPREINKLDDLRLFRDTVQLVLEENKIEYDKDDGIPTHPVSLILATKIGIYTIDECYQLLKVADGYTAIGAGKEVALGALHVAKQMQVVGETATKYAVKSAIKHSIYCGGRVYYARVTTDGYISK